MFVRCLLGRFLANRPIVNYSAQHLRVIVCAATVWYNSLSYFAT